jgi:SSS family solute:Na+ symporter
MVTWVILIVYLAIMIAIGVYCRQKTKNVADFVLGGRSLGPWFTAFAYGTSYFSAVVFIGYAGQFGWVYGVSSTWIGIGNALLGSWLAWAVLGRRTRIMTKHLHATTMPEFFERRFNSKPLKICAALIVFIFLIPYTASVYNGLSRLFSMAFGFDYAYCILAMAVITAVYVILGGYMATAINDLVQGVIMLGGIAAVIFFALQEKGGLFTALKSMSEISADGIEAGSLGSLFGPDPINLIGVIILTSLGTWGLPQMVQKFYAIKDNAAIRRGSIISTIFALIVAGGSYFLGGFGRIFVDHLEVGSNGKPVYDSIIPTMLSSALPDILIGIVVVLVLSASMSTLASLVLTSSATLTIDLIKPLRKKMKEKEQIFIMRILIAVFLIISVLIALNPNAYITTLMSISWGALAGAFLAPFLYGLFWKKVTTAAVWASFIAGVGVTVVHMMLFSLGWFPGLVDAVKGLGWKLDILSPINAGAFAMLLGLVLVPIVSVFTKKPDASVVDYAFSGYREEE